MLSETARAVEGTPHRPAMGRSVRSMPAVSGWLSRVSTTRQGSIVWKLAPSSPRMVPCPWASASVALTGWERLTKKVSSGSSIRSPITLTAIVSAVWPGWNVRVPEVAT
jgi:hypothetical protein